MKKCVKYSLKAVKWFFIVFCFYAFSLCFRQERIPGEWVAGAFALAAPSNLVFHCDSASFGIVGGFHLKGLRVYDLSRARNIEPVAAAEHVSILPFRRALRIVGAKFPRLHDAYYEINTFAEPLGDKPIDFSFPKLLPFHLELVRPDVLGLLPERVTARVKMRSARLDFMNVHLDWRDCDRPMALDGWCRVDLEQRRVRGRVEGHATQAQIRPFMVALDLPVVLPYMDSFTGVTEPVPAVCEWNVNLVDNAFRLDLDLHPLLGRYNGVPMSRADGKITLNTTFGRSWMRYQTGIGPLKATDKKGRQLEGMITVHGMRSATNEVVDLVFDASSELPLKSVLDIIDYMNDGTLDCLVCETPPEVTVKGRLATDVARQAGNDLSGTLRFAHGSLFGISLHSAESDFSYVGSLVSFTNAAARGKAGGSVTGSAELSVPGLDSSKSTFALKLNYTGGTIAEMAEAFGVAPGEMAGKVEGALELSGALRTNALDRLSGSGRLTVREGSIAQMKIFLGLTDLIAKQVPGFEKIVTQSEMSCDFTIGGGKISSRNILIEGSFFSISAKGSYDFINDALDFTVRVTLLKNESILGKFLIRPILWPFSKLLLEFKVEGGLDAPKWNYISILDRIL